MGRVKIGVYMLSDEYVIVIKLIFGKKKFFFGWIYFYSNLEYGLVI